MSNCTCGCEITANARKKTSKVIPVDKNQRIDPTRTTTLRKRMIADVNRRFKLLIKDINDAIITQDCFGLKQSTPLPLFNVTPRQFDFPRSPDKVKAFMRWLKDMERRRILVVEQRPGRIGQTAEEAWTDVYIRSAYQEGIRRAGQELKKAGIAVPIPSGALGVDPMTLAFNTPIHADRVGLLYTRTFSELEGITAAMDQQISGILAQGMAEGRNPYEIAKDITGRVEAIGMVRARTLARTEIIRAHHLAAMQEYKNAGLVGVKIQSEWLTAGFDVCPKCAPLEGKVFSIEEITPMIPRHPNCRCTAIPYIEGVTN